jgi:hypothetical protein
MIEDLFRTKSSRRIFGLLLLFPIVLGIPGVGMHFVPNPSHRLAAILLAIAYVAAVAIFFRRNSSATPSAKVEIIPTPLKLMLGMVLAAYLLYVSLHMTIPALVTQAFGSSADKEYVIEDLKKTSSRRGTFCPYRMRLREVAAVLDDSYCVSESFAKQHSAGQSIRLSGKETFLGFRF